VVKDGTGRSDIRRGTELEEAGTVIHAGVMEHWADKESRCRCDKHLTMWLRMLEERLPYMRGRAHRIARGTEIIGHKMEFDDDEMYALSLAARFHDLGMLAVPDMILLRTAALTPEEKAVVARHPYLGGLLVHEAFPDFPQAVEGIWYHHERADGSGLYGLRNSEIPTIAKVVALIEAVEAMANDRPYREAMSCHEITEEVDKHIDSQFDRQVVAVFRRVPLDVYAAVRPETKGRRREGKEPADEM